MTLLILIHYPGKNETGWSWRTDLSGNIDVQGMNLYDGRHFWINVDQESPVSSISPPIRVMGMSDCTPVGQSYIKVRDPRGITDEDINNSLFRFSLLMVAGPTGFVVCQSPAFCYPHFGLHWYVLPLVSTLQHLITAGKNKRWWRTNSKVMNPRITRKGKGLEYNNALDHSTEPHHL